MMINYANEEVSIVNKTIKILKINNVCDRFNVIFEEKQNKHFHCMDNAKISVDE